MCGFTAYCYLNEADASNDSKFPPVDLTRSLELGRHRGPDGLGTFTSSCGRCGLGHARLSIIDLDGGKQPISNEDHSIHCVVNGELYDYKEITQDLEEKGHVFKTRSDSEIALHLYEEFGLSFAEKLRGEFAICLWDNKKKRLIVVRDRFGIKPVYYTVVDGLLLVASEIKSFLGLGWIPEWDVSSIVQNGPALDNRTCFKGVNKLPPAHYLVATSSGTVTVNPYWDTEYPDRHGQENRTVDEMIMGVRGRLQDAVRTRLRADVPVGIYLSGGIDSSCIAGIATEMLREKDPHAKIEAFSISFKDGGGFDEGDFARRTAEFCGASYHEVSLTDADLIDAFEDTVWHTEQPTPNLNGAAKFLLSKRVQESGYKVVLTGEGSDEHFGGYSFLHADYLSTKDKAMSWPNKSALEQENSKEIGTTDLSTRMLGGVTVQHRLSPLLSLSDDGYYTSETISTHGTPDLGLVTAEVLDGRARSKAMNSWHPLHSAMYVVTKTLLPNMLCNMLGDRTEMAHSIEGRTPFLDHILCEYVNGLPPSVKICAEKHDDEVVLNEKWILKQAVKPYITEEIYQRRKQMFAAPVSQRQSKKFKALMDRLLQKEAIDQLGWADWNKISQTKATFLENGDPVLFKDLLIIMSFVVLSQRFSVKSHE